MISHGRIYLLDYPWITVVPGLTIFLALPGMKLLSDAVRDLLDPQPLRAR
jgi:ABC-type dipeptide/oligopeptide/nickel transport system permease subunit